MIAALTALLLVASHGNAPQDDECGAAEQQAMVGTHAPGLTVVTINREVRIIRPKTRVTNQYNPKRLNIQLDASEVVIAIFCG